MIPRLTIDELWTAARNDVATPTPLAVKRWQVRLQKYVEESATDRVAVSEWTLNRLASALAPKTTLAELWTEARADTSKPTEDALDKWQGRYLRYVDAGDEPKRALAELISGEIQAALS